MKSVKRNFESLFTLAMIYLLVNILKFSIDELEVVLHQRENKLRGESEKRLSASLFIYT